jgi:hypothetical protein
MNIIEALEARDTAARRGPGAHHALGLPTTWQIRRLSGLAEKIREDPMAMQQQ